MREFTANHRARNRRITDLAVLTATGRHWAQWFRILDSSPECDRGPEALTSWLTREHAEIGGWWCQVITRRWASDRQTESVLHRPA